SLTIAEEVNNKSHMAVASNNIGDVYRKQSRYAEALRYYRNSLEISKGIDEKALQCMALTNIGRVHLLQGNYLLAREELTNAIAAIEQLRTRIVGDEQQQQQFFQRWLTAYHLLVQLSVDENNSAAALTFAERGKARALLDTLQTGHVDITR